MAFVYEKVKEEDRKLWLSMGFKDFKGKQPLGLSRNDKWCIDKDINGYLVCVGAGGPETPIIYEFFLQGQIIRLNVSMISVGSIDLGVEIIWNIVRILIPKELWKQKNEIVEMIRKAFSINTSYRNSENIKSITVNIKCEPELIKSKK